MSVVGYGTLLLPNASYNNVLEVKENIEMRDSIFVDLFHTGVYTPYTYSVSHAITYEFLRNNTFGSSYLMYLNTAKQLFEGFIIGILSGHCLPYA